MNSKLRIACGVSVVFTTLAFGHIMVHDTHHLLANHASRTFIGVHAIVALVLAVLSLVGGVCLLIGVVRQNSCRLWNQ